MNTYTKTFTVKCPNDDEAIEYTLVIECLETIMVEDINWATNIKTPAFHESIADGIHALLGGRQAITAVHQGVEITTTRTDAGLENAIKNAYFKYGHSDWTAIASDVMESLK